MARKNQVDVLELYPKSERVRPYEILFAIHPDLDEKSVQDLVKELQGRIQAHGGKVTKVDYWGKRMMAYPIRKRRDAYYVLMYFNMPARHLEEIHRFLRYQEPILRYLIRRLDEE